MRKLLLLVTALFLTLSIYAQSSETPNRLLIHEGYNTKGYVIEKVDSLTFATVQGEVAADIELLSFDLEKVALSITRTPSCVGFKIGIEGSVIIASLSDDQIAQYINNQSENIYYQDFESAELSGIELQAGTEYSIITVGIDEYGVLCDIRRVDFTTEDPNIVGDPHVEAELVEANLYDFTVGFTPNQYVSRYYVVAGEKGLLQQQYEQFAPMFGFTNIGEMITMWGIERTGKTSNQWTQMAPNTEYEVYIQAYDAEGNMAPYQIFELSTQSLGGEGIAEVAITLGEYKLMEWYDDQGNPVMLPSQFITFTPNDQSSAYRLGVYLEREYDQYEDEIKQDLQSENTMNMVGWFQYEELTTDFQIDPNTACVAVASAKNVNGEWGPITEFRFTTPEEAPTRSNSGNISARQFSNSTRTTGTIPSFKQKGQLRLISK